MLKNILMVVGIVAIIFLIAGGVIVYRLSGMAQYFKPNSLKSLLLIMQKCLALHPAR